MKGLSINPDTDIKEIRKEYQSLKWRAEKKIDSFDSLLWWIVHPTLTLAVTIFFAIRTRDIGQTFLAAVVYGYIPGMFASMIVTGLLSLAIGKRFGQYLENRRLTSAWYQRYQYLRTYIPEYEEAEKIRLAEEKRIRLLPVRTEIRLIGGEVGKIEEVVKASENVIWRKRKWYSEYREYEDAIEECIPMLEGLENQGNLTRARFDELAEEASYEFYSLFRHISGLRQRCELVLAKMQGMKDWTPPVRTRTRPVRNSTGADFQVPRVQSSSPASSHRPPLVANDDRQTVVQQPVVVAPPQPPERRVLNRELKKIPFEDYVGAAKAKMTIGDLGEVVALHYEIRRVEAETGVSSLGKVTRVSEYTDGVGYDIESFSQNEKVFIEVKSTSGSFWTDFYLSANERRVMNNLAKSIGFIESLNYLKRMALLSSASFAVKLRLMLPSISRRPITSSTRKPTRMVMAPCRLKHCSNRANGTGLWPCSGNMNLAVGLNPRKG
ncbi:MAG: DUF3883 domain-containing protein [Pyrinomonadaceae bacterium]